jgi:hypothetical protein
VNTTIWCECCFRRHGEGCPATTTNDAGQAVCIFCADGCVCPIQRRKAAFHVKPNGAATATAEGYHKMDHPEAASQRTCKVAGCSEALGPRNRSGYCKAHRHIGDPRRDSSRAHAVANGSTSPAKKNGSVPRPTPDPRVAERVDRFLADLSLQDKLHLCQAWLDGRI